VREILRYLAVVGDISVPVGQAFGFDDAESLLPDLARRGLVQFVHGPEESYSLMRPLRDFFDSQLALTPGDRTTLHRQAADLFARRGSYAEALHHLVAAADHTAVVSLLVEHGTMLVNTGQISAVLAAAELPPAYLDDPRIQRILGHARQVRGQLAAARECFERAREDREELPPGLAWRMALIPYACGEFSDALATYDRARLDREDTVDEVQVLAWAASACRMTGDYDRCRDLARRARAAADRCHDPSAQAASLTAVGMLAAAQGDRHTMDACLCSALEAAETADDNIQIPRIRLLRALHLVELGQAREALAEAETALRFGERNGYTHVCAIALTHRAAAKAHLGFARLDEALADFAIARDLLTDMGSRFAAWPLSRIGDVHRRRGQLTLAEAAYEEALVLAEPHHEIFGMASALNGLARTRAADDIDTARALAERAVGQGEGLRYVQALLTRGWVALSAGDREAAIADATRASEAARARRENPGLAEALELAVLASPDPLDKTARLDEAVQIWHEIGYPIEEAQARLVAARLQGSGAGATADLAKSALQEHQVHIDSRQAAGPLAALAAAAPSLSIRTLGAYTDPDDRLAVEEGPRPAQDPRGTATADPQGAADGAAVAGGGSHQDRQPAVRAALDGTGRAPTRPAADGRESPGERRERGVARPEADRPRRRALPGRRSDRTGRSCPRPAGARGAACSRGGGVHRGLPRGRPLQRVGGLHAPGRSARILSPVTPPLTAASC